MKNQSFIFLTFFFIAIVCYSAAYGSKRDLEYWQYLHLRNWNSGPFKLYTIGEVRVWKDLSKFYYYRIAENFAYSPFPYLDFEAHYSLIYIKPKGALHFTHTHRLEFEANSSLRFKNGITLKWKNRLDLLKVRQVSHIQFVFRHRIMALFPVENGGKITSISMYDEVFYDFDTQKFTQNRFVPIEISIALTPQTMNLSIYMMIRHKFSFILNKWYNSVVLGSELNF